MGLAETQRGALVANVTAGGPAEKAGLIGSTKPATIDGQDVQVGGDVITAIDGQPVKRFEDLVTFLARNGKVGQTVKLTILRDGKEMTVSLTLAARPGAGAAQGNTQPRGNQRPTPAGTAASDACAEGRLRRVGATRALHRRPLRVRG